MGYENSEVKTKLIDSWGYKVNTMECVVVLVGIERHLLNP